MQQYDTRYHEQLGSGAAHAEPAADGPGKTVKIVPITEGERTIGHRDNGDESPAIWGQDALRHAVDHGLLSDPVRPDTPNTLIVKGTGGRNPHFAMDEQVDPDRILGRVDRWEYEEGTGPVGYATLADEGIADRIELGLLDVSGDWLRRLGEYDQELGGKPVTEIIGLPRVTVLERGAAQGATIEVTPDTAEALGYNPDGAASSVSAGDGPSETDDDSDGNADDDDPSDDDDADDSDTGDDGDEPAPLAQHATSGDAVRWDSNAGGSREPASIRYGVVVDNLQEDDDEMRLVAVYQPTTDYDGWEPRDETQRMSDDSLDRVGGDGVASLPPVSQVAEQDAGLIDRLASRVAKLLGTETVAQHAATISNPSYSGTTENSWERPTLDDFDGELSAARDSATIIRDDGETFGDLGLFVVDGNGTLNLAGLRAANSRVRQTDGVSESQADRLQSMYRELAAEEFDVEWGEGEGEGEGESEQQANDAHVDEPAEPGTADRDTDPGAGPEQHHSQPDIMVNDNNTQYDELRAQLADVRDAKESLAEETEQQAETIDRLEQETAERDTIRSVLAQVVEHDADTLERDDLSRATEQVVSEHEQQSERIETLEDELAPLKELLAEIAADGSMLDPERVAATHSVTDLVEMLAENTDDEEKDFSAKVQEQLTANLAPRGDAGSGDGSGGAELDEEQAAEVEQLAQSVMTAKDWKQAQDYSSFRGYIRTAKGVDPANAASEQELRQQIKSNAAGDGGED